MSRAALQSLFEATGRQAGNLWRVSCQFLWPAVCAVCASAIEENCGHLCRDCWQSLSEAVGHDYCRRCGRRVSRYGIIQNRCGGCLDEKLIYDGLCQAGSYDGLLKQMLLALKFRDKVELLDYLGPVFRQAFAAGGFADKIDMLVPVPLHWRRRFQRGFNQAFLLAQYLQNECPIISEDLVRIRYTPHQWQMQTDAQKRRNVSGAFAVRKGHPFAGKSVCLVDDITTSRATLKECTETLKQAGAAAVYAAVAAVAKRIN